jgi:nucleoside-diphosphate-sugar epimerase
MSRVLVTGGPGLVGSRVILRLLAAGREPRTMAGSPTPATEVRAIPDIGDVQPSARGSFIATYRDHDAGRLDAVAGSEFVDDRIRLLE